MSINELYIVKAFIFHKCVAFYFQYCLLIQRFKYKLSIVFFKCLGSRHIHKEIVARFIQKSYYNVILPNVKRNCFAMSIML